MKISVHVEDACSENNWTFELGFGKGVDVPYYVIVGFLQKGQFGQQTQNIFTFHQPSVTFTQSIIGTEKKPDVRTYCTFDHENFSQAYAAVVCCFSKHSTKHNTLQSCTTQKNFTSSNDYPEHNRLRYKW